MVDDDISECDFTALRSTYQERHGFAYDDYRITLRRRLILTLRSSLAMLILRKSVLVIHLS
jgi:hypothetical protein